MTWKRFRHVRPLEETRWQANRSLDPPEDDYAAVDGGALPSTGAGVILPGNDVAPRVYGDGRR